MSKIPVEPSTPGPWSLTTGRIVTAGVLAAITIILGVTRLGYIPVPNLTGYATILQVPSVIAGVLEGPIVGMAVGVVFGLLSFFTILPDPFVAIARIPIGLVSWLVFLALKRVNRDLAAAVAGLLGALTNTVLVLTAGILRGLLPIAAVPGVVPQIIVEMIFSAILTVIVVRAVFIVRGRYIRAPETKSRDEQPF